MVDPGEGPGGPPPFFLDQTEARRAENIFLGDRPPPPLSKGVDDPPPQHTSLSPLRLITCHHYGWRCRGP